MLKNDPKNLPLKMTLEDFSGGPEARLQTPNAEGPLLDPLSGT